MKAAEFLKEMRDHFPAFWNIVESDHIEHQMFNRGHDFLHAVIVAQYGFLIADSDNVGRLAWFAGMLHNLDRMLGRENRSKIAAGAEDRLNRTDLTSLEKSWIIEAVLKHGQLNDPSDNPVTITLKDADRLGNIGPAFLSRSTQHMTSILGGHVVLDPRFVDEKASTEYGKNPTAMDDLQACLEWEPMLRLDKAREIGQPYFKFLQLMLVTEGARLNETGIIDNADDLFGRYFDEAYTHLKK